MKRRNSFLLMCVLVLFSTVSVFTHVSYGGNEKINFIIIYPGGPDPGTEGKTMITQFIDILTRQTTLKRSHVEGTYYNNIEQAKARLKKSGNAFIMGSLGFYLSNREQFNLMPLSLVLSEGKSAEKYYLVVKKGGYGSLAELKGKVLSGNILYEDTKYLNSIVFNNSIDVSQHFTMKPTDRPLSAVRRIARGKVDAVLLNTMQYESLKKLPATFNKLQVLYTSPEAPRLGFMMAETSATKKVKDEILGALNKMCEMEEGKRVCGNFGITGFKNITSETLNEVSQKYNSGN